MLSELYIYQNARSNNKKTSFHLPILCKLTPPMKMAESVPKRQHITFRCRGITQKKE